MKRTRLDILGSLDRNREVVEAVLRQPESLRRSARLAEFVRSYCPGSSLYACLLREYDDGQICVLDEAGNPRPEWSETIRGDLEGHPSGSHPPGLSGHTLIVATMACRDRSYGVLAVASPEDTTAEDRTIVRGLLALCGQQLGLLFDAADERRVLREEVAGLTRLANIGELTGLVLHDYNNLLNTMVLQLAVLEKRFPQLADDVAEIRKQGGAATSLLRQLQQYSQHQRSTYRECDLNQVVREAAAELCRELASATRRVLVDVAPLDSPAASPTERTNITILLALALESPAIEGARWDLKRLLMFLLSNAIAAIAPEIGTVTIRTESASDKVLLHVDDSGPSIAVESLPHVFEPGIVLRPGMNGLEMVACRSLARRLQGKIRVENRPEGGVRMLVELPRALPK